MSEDKENFDTFNDSNSNDEGIDNKEAPLNLEGFKEKFDEHFEVLRDSGLESGKLYLESSRSLAIILLEAKANKLLSQVKPELLDVYKICHSTSEKMKNVDKCWGERSKAETAVFCRKFNDKNKSKLEFISGLAVKKAAGKKKVGSFVEFRVDNKKDKIFVELQGQGLIDFDKVTGAALKALVFGNPKTAPKLKGRKLEKSETKIRDQAIIFRDIVVKYLPDKYVELMASRKDWDSVFTDLSDSSSESPGSADAVDNRASDVPLNVQGDIHTNDGTTAESIPESGDTTTLVPDAVDDTGSKVLEVAEETVDEADAEGDVENTVDEAVVEAAESADDADVDFEADVEAVDAERSGKDLEDRSSLDFEIDGNSDRLDDSYFEIAKKLVVAEALETETDVKVKKVRSARNIAPSIGAHGNMPYAGGAF